MKFLFRNRFSYFDLVGILMISSLLKDSWTYILLAIPWVVVGGLIELMLERADS